MSNEERKEKMMKSWMLRLQEKWEVDSLFQVLIILVVFSLAGSTIAMTKKYYFGFFGFDEHTHWAIKIIVALLIYQVVLLFYGTVLGQFKFFWKKEKKMLLGVAKLFTFLFRLPLKLFSKSNSK